MRSLAVAVATAAFGAGMVWAETAATAPAGQTPRPVVSVIVRATPPTDEAIFYGQVAARVVTNLGFAQGGELAERPVDQGDVVQAGALLAMLDPTDLDARQRAAEASLEAAGAQLRQTIDSEERLRALVDRGSATAVQLESATLARAAAEAAVGQAAAALASAEDLRDSARLLAPEAGVVLATLAEPGANLAPGQAVVQLAGLSGREVLIDLTESEVSALRPGTRFHVTLDADPAIATGATLVSVDPVAERATRTRRVHLGLQAPPEAFRIGALARVSLTGDTVGTPTIRLPAGALLADGGQTFVWRIARPSGVVARVQVDSTATGPGPGPGLVQITAGLSDGDEVLLKGVHSVADGDIVGPQVSP